MNLVTEIETKNLMIYNTGIEVVDLTKDEITFYIKDLNKTYTVLLKKQTNNKEEMLDSIKLEDQVLLKYTGKDMSIFVYIKDCLLNYLLTDKPDTTKSVFEIEVNKRTQLINIEQVDIQTLNLYVENSMFTYDGLVSSRKSNFNIKYKSDKLNNGLLAICKYGKYYLIIKYDKKNMKLIFNKVIFDIVANSKGILFDLINEKDLKILVEYNKRNKIVDLSKLKKGETIQLFSKAEFLHFKDDNLLGVIIVNRTRYYIYLKMYGVYLTKSTPQKVTQYKSYLRSISFGKNIYLFGRFVHHAYNSYGEYDYLYNSDFYHRVTKFKRPFSRVKFIKQFGYFKINVKKMDLESKVHYPLFVGNEKFILHNIPMNNGKEPSKVYSTKKNKKKIHVLRSSIHNNVMYTIVPYSKMYSKLNKLKAKIAKFVSNKFYKNKNYNVNLYFEKQASKADESGFRVFEKVKEKNYSTSKNYFILDKNCDMYKNMKLKHGKDIIPRFSYRHYLNIFNADYYISSDLSNHVINDRIYNNLITDKLKEVPLIFLQHGIMFAKPVENPLGKIFYKEYAAYNIFKNVVSSRLEAQEFYKMGYDDLDLIYSGLATFDYANLDLKSDKIVYMPTYRYWEEGLIYSGDIEKTSYYRSIIKVIKEFEGAGLLDKLLIVSHNKFSQYVYESLPEYRHLLGLNPSEALKVARIFITDFSSAIYDSIYRGAYPIFYWEDKEYLIDNYGATPPVNKNNAPGPVAYDTDQLINYVKNAISNEYLLESEYAKKYLDINQFNDNKNTERIVNYMIKDKIL
ncbi:CDP-glycerol glycerophosphotransferase (TagB/SpsB family) [Virgibacillus halotolerans]|uniref:CDP-glycerol glycerophosphotransferase family protein n=1 Tax=Virgibacillus halotolerans TaxID=1071053 RepID=UPI0019619221|nr:CDP-glycerol glycerophosphotransferase family protein [Virgibacillus halotolerans]MBM7600175.1 CDP-glycerol glycerophosphotransferase (TagB/SpsB family) [Virgibacillus halotolerans]